jgi:ABC-2 type transport system permease protein
MTAYLSFEWLKLSKRWMPRIIALLLMGITVLAFWGQSTRSSARPEIFLPRGWLVALVLCSFFAPFFWPVLGGSWAGNEYGWGTIRTILTRKPTRINHALAALIVLSVGLALALLAVLVTGTLASIVVSLLTGNSLFVSGVFTASWAGILVKGFLAAWYDSLFYLLLAYMAATVARSAAVGIGVGIGATLAEFIVGGIFRALGGIWNDIALQFPVNYTQGLIQQVVHSGLLPGSGVATVDPGTPSASASIIAVTIYGAVFLAITLVTVRTRDIAS